MLNLCYLFADDVKVADIEPEKYTESVKQGSASGTFH